MTTWSRCNRWLHRKLVNNYMEAMPARAKTNKELRTIIAIIVDKRKFCLIQTKFMKCKQNLQKSPIVSPLLGTLFCTLNSLIRKEIGLVLGVNKELEKLSKTLSIIRDVLEDVEYKQFTDKSICNWLKDLKDAAYTMQDILDECADEALLPESEILESNSCNVEVLTDSVSSCFDFKRITFQRTIGKRIKNLREKFDEMVKERSLYFQLNLNSPLKDVKSRGKQFETTSVLSELHIYGRNEVKQYLVNLLINNDHDRQGRDVSICPIIGMGGLGKTTLAQMVYNDEMIKEYYAIRCWIFVSQDFNLRTLLKAIIESLGQNATDLEMLDTLQRRIQDILNGKRFLLVLDDLWNENEGEWYSLKSSLTCGDKGICSIIVTTRLETVALLTATLRILRLELMSEHDCFTIFKHHAFDMGNGESDPNLEAIGKEIVKKCGGIPLAAKALGSLLRFNREKNEWLRVRDSKICDLQRVKEDSILPILKLSYNYLPSHLMQCFAYCSIFPKDYTIRKDELIHLWMANDFIRPKRGMEELEDDGNEIFNHLIMRSFFQDVEEDENGNVTCKMHNLMHDLACSIMADESSIVEIYNANSSVCESTIRHLSLGYSSLTSIPEPFVPKFPPLLRTLTKHQWPYHKSLNFSCPLIFSNVKCLRVLILSQTRITTISVSIGQLKHLRYIDLSETDVTSVPGSICSLKNLQTLKLNGCKNLESLPKDMRKMEKLLHLNITGCDNLAGMPAEMGKLIQLQALSTFIVGSTSTGNGINELQELDRLRGKLEVKGIKHVPNSIEAKKANLAGKQNLHSLVLHWSENNEFQHNDDHSEEEAMAVAEGLKPHTNIRRLLMAHYQGLKFPCWMGAISCLPNLVKITLEGCTRCEHLPSLGQLPLLQILEISKMDSVKCIGNELYGDRQGQCSFFQSLRKLSIRVMANLEEWSSPLPQAGENQRREEGFVSEFPNLESLIITGCPKLTTCPPLPSLLQIFVIAFCDVIKCLPIGWQHSTLLQSLTIADCPELELLVDDFRHLTSLKKLTLIDLRKLISSPVVGSRNVEGTLKYLEIRSCPDITSWPQWMANLTSPITLKISDCQGLPTLPEGLQHLITKTVNIIRCHPDLQQQILTMLNNLALGAEVDI